jgi:HEAT repeat protein
LLGTNVLATHYWLETSELEWCQYIGQKPRRKDLGMKLLRRALTALIFALPLYAQQDSAASLTIRFVDGTSRFHVGEVISIELSFKASISGMYDLEMRNYDRSGRLNIEQFHLTPPGRDPLQRYYSIGGFIGGGLGGPRELSSEPQIMREDLNEWVALDNPGHYSLYLTSGRVSRRDADKNEPLELRSNSLEFDVVSADPAWQQQALSSATATLNMESSTAEEKNAALRTLRFLDTPASVRELVHLLGTHSDGSHWNETAGLAGSRYQSLVVRELEQQMSAPDTAVTGNYLYILAKLKFQLDHEPPSPYPEKDPQQQKSWTDRRQAEDKELMELQDSLYTRAASLVSGKRGAARAETVQTLLLRPSREPSDVKPLAGLPAEEVAAAFLNLSEDQQWGLLMSFWERLKDPAMTAPLKKVVQQPNMNHQMLRDLALRCLYDLDPSEATPIILEEIKHPHLDNGMFTVKGETLGLLPNETLPQYDEILAARIEEKNSRTRSLDAQLIGRYSTKEILPRVKSVYESAGGGWDCVSEDGFVVYFLRVDADYGVKRLAKKPPTTCMTNALAVITKMQFWSKVEPGIIARLNDTDLNWARQAAEVLAKYGGAQAKKAMWERLRKFHGQWSERGNELAIRPGMRADANEAVGFQFGLVEAIGKAQAWLLANDEITELENLTLGQERDNVKQWHWSSPVNLNVSFFGEKIMATINQYSATDLTSLKAKLAQYPSGTKFWLNIIGSPDRVAPVLTVISEIAAEHGFLVDSPQPTH